MSKVNGEKARLLMNEGLIDHPKQAKDSAIEFPSEGLMLLWSPSADGHRVV